MTGIGDNFDDFLREEGIYDECKTLAMKKIFISQLEQEMEFQNLTKSEMAKRMMTCRTAIDNILNPEYNSTIDTLEQFAAILGKKIKLSLV
jgi:predicted XRE-type DNA-binding protein